MVFRPRHTLAEVIQAPAWIATWSVILVTWAILAGPLLLSDVGPQAVVDERVRVIESFGGDVTDSEYAALQASPPWWVYLTSGGRTLLTPLATVVVAGGVWLVARAEQVRATMRQSLAIAVHVSVVLLIGQLVATPLHFVRESLTSPLNLAAVLPLMQEGTVQATFFGTMDLFALWWMVLLAMGLSVLTGRPTTRYLGALTAGYVAFAAIVAAVIAVRGGN
jgi:hypothetical protein